MDVVRLGQVLVLVMGDVGRLSGLADADDVQDRVALGARRRVAACALCPGVSRRDWCEDSNLTVAALKEAPDPAPLDLFSKAQDLR